MIAQVVNKKKRDKLKKQPEANKPGTESYRKTREDLNMYAIVKTKQINQFYTQFSRLTLSFTLFYSYSFYNHRFITRFGMSQLNSNDLNNFDEMIDQVLIE